MEEVIKANALPLLMGAITFLTTFAVVRHQVVLLQDNVAKLEGDIEKQNEHLNRLTLLEYQFNELNKKLDTTTMAIGELTSAVHELRTHIAVMKG